MLRNERGSVLALTAVSMIALLGLTGLVIDGGSIYIAKAQLHKAANAAALSGAQELTQSQTAVQNVVHQVLHEHGENHSIDLLEVVPENRVTVGLTRSVPLGFSGIFGRNEVPVSVKATAELGLMGEAYGAAPVGIDENIPLIYNQVYTLKVDETGVDHGNFGIIALGGSGADTYEDNLRFGYKENIAIGDILETRGGNVAGKTRSSIAERIANCPYPVGEIHHRDCSRILLVPVYKPHKIHSGKLIEIEVTGFAYFYITEPTADGKSITGMFIKRAGTGIVKPGAASKGAFAIRLTE